jgi:hypothetical protein
MTCDRLAAPQPKRQKLSTRPNKRRVGAKQKAHAKFHQQCSYDGEEYQVGDDVYILLEKYDYDSDEDEACEICGSSHFRNPMLECSKCLRGFHSRCLKPAVTKIPEVSI